MPIVTSTDMFRKAYEGGYAIGAFNVNNMEIVQGITEAAAEVRSPLILQVSAGARKYAKHVYLMKLIEAAVDEIRFGACEPFHLEQCRFGMVVFGCRHLRRMEYRQPL